MHDWKLLNFSGPLMRPAPDEPPGGIGELERRFKETCPEGYISAPGDSPAKGGPPEPQTLVVHGLVHTGMI